MGCAASTSAEDDPLSYLISSDKWEGAMNWIKENSSGDEFTLRRDILAYSLAYYVNDEVHNELILRLLEMGPEKIGSNLKTRVNSWQPGCSAIQVNLEAVDLEVYSKLIKLKEWALDEIKPAFVRAVRIGSFNHVRMIVGMSNLTLVKTLMWGIIPHFPVEEVEIILNKINMEKAANRINLQLENDSQVLAQNERGVERVLFYSGVTALSISCLEYVEEVSCAIIDSGADWTIVDSIGYTAFDYCIFYGNLSVARYMISKSKTCKKKHELIDKIMVKVKCGICKIETKDCKYKHCLTCNFQVCHKCFENKPELKEIKNEAENPEVDPEPQSVEKNHDQPKEIRKHKKLVMISYNVKSCSRVAKAMRSVLEKEETAKPWICEQDLKPGQDWRSTIGKVVMACDVFVMLVNEEWIESGECNDEYNVAKARNLKNQRPLMIPVFMGKDILEKEHEKVYSLTSNYNFLIFDNHMKVDELCGSIKGLL